MKKPTPKQLISPMCASRFSGVGIPTIYRWIRIGRIPATIVEVLRVKVTLRDIENAIAAHPKYHAHYRKAGLAASAYFKEQRAIKRARRIRQSWKKAEPVDPYTIEKGRDA
jgi:hypothetical protein